MDIYRYFDTGNSQHSESNAYLLALPAYYIYDKADKTRKTIPGRRSFHIKVENLFQSLSSDDKLTFKFMRQGTAEAGILSNSRLVIVVFRGTDDDANNFEYWSPKVGNMNYKMIRVRGSWGVGRVHKGFYNALSPLYNSVRSEIHNRLKSGNKSLYFTGHSRGAALATLCAYGYRAEDDNAKVGGIYLFGSPRVGDAVFNKEYDRLGLARNTFRWVRYRDFANQFPDYTSSLPRYRTTTNRYYHVGSLNYIDRKGQISMMHKHSDFEPGYGLSSLNDHRMDRYCMAMFNRLSKKKRINPTNPNELTKHDVKSALPVNPG